MSENQTAGKGDDYMGAPSVFCDSSHYSSEDRLYVIQDGVPYSVNSWRHKELMDRIIALEKKMDAVLGALGSRGGVEND